MPTDPKSLNPMDVDNPEKNISQTGGSLYPANYDSKHRADLRPAAKVLRLNQAEYLSLRDLMLNRIGLDFPEDKREMLGRGLFETMAAVGCPQVDQFYEMLFSSPNSSPVWERLISALTIGETYFFRHTPHFDALSKNILPDLILRRASSGRTLRIWSAGCATGEEPYSLAMLLRETIPDIDNWKILILATDLNREVLTRARAGRYSAWSFRSVEKRVQDTYFRPAGNQFVISDTIKQMVTFDYLNLVGDGYPSLHNNTHAMDLIFCRNVTIYFSPEVTQEVVRRFYASLNDGGWLVPGPSEPNLIYYKDFRSLNYPGTVVYQKPTQEMIKARPVPAPKREPLPSLVKDTRTPSTPVLPPLPPVLKPLTPPDAYKMAEELWQAGRVDEAVAKLSEKVAQSPNFVPSYILLGKIYANRGELGAAQQWCERALQIDKLNPEPYFILSMVYQQNNALEQAADYLRKAIYLDRDFALAHYNLAQIYSRQGEKTLMRKSLQNVQRALDGKPRNEVVPEGDGLVIGRLLDLVELDLASNQD